MFSARGLLSTICASLAVVGVLAPSGEVFAATSRASSSRVSAVKSAPVPVSAHGSAAGKSYDAGKPAAHAAATAPKVRGAVGMPTAHKSLLPPTAKAASSLTVGHVSAAAAGTSTATGVPRGLTKSSVEVPSARTATSSTYANLDGTFTTKVYRDRVHIKDKSGVWQNVQPPVLKPAVTGTRRAMVASGAGVSLGDSGSSLQLINVQMDSTHSVSFTLLGAQSVTGQATGANMHYSDVLPSTDLNLTTTSHGVKEAIVLKSAAAVRTWTFALNLQGLTAKLDSHGDVYLYDETGAVRGVVPHGQMQDANIDPHSQQGALSDLVNYTLVDLPDRQQGLQVDVNSAWLDDPSRVYPVTVDPSTLTSETDSDDTYVMSNFNANYSGDGVLKVGTYDGGTHNGAAYLHYNGLGWLASAHILQANLSMWEKHRLVLHTVRGQCLRRHGRLERHNDAHLARCGLFRSGRSDQCSVRRRRRLPI
jgi:hypothetical protein